MRLSKLFEDNTKFKSLEDVRKAGTEDLAKVNKAIESIVGTMEDLIKQVTNGKKNLDKLNDDLEQAMDANDIDVMKMLKQHIVLQNEQISSASKQHKIHERYLHKLKTQQKKLMGILSSKSNLETIYNKINHPGDLTKQAPADALIDQLQKAQTSPDTASPSDVRGIGRQL